MTLLFPWPLTFEPVTDSCDFVAGTRRLWVTSWVKEKCAGQRAYAYSVTVRARPPGLMDTAERYYPDDDLELFALLCTLTGADPQTPDTSGVP